jgi:transcriptional regulator with XRE-family HTH domain
MEHVDETRSVMQRRLGRIIAESRLTATYQGAVGLLSQERLGAQLDLSRSQIAHIEEGRAAIDPALTARICRHLKIPESQWRPLTEEWAAEAFTFVYLTQEYVGRPLDLMTLSGVDASLGIERVRDLFRCQLSKEQSFYQFNSILTFLGERAVTQAFFSRFLTADAFRSLDAYTIAARAIQAAFMRIYGNFRRGWTELARCVDLESRLKALLPRNLDHYRARAAFLLIDEIEPRHLRELGYIAVSQIRQEQAQRRELQGYLSELSKSLDEGDDEALERMPAKRLRRVKTLLQRLDSRIDAEDFRATPLYGRRPTSQQLRDEASRIAPQESELDRIAETQSRAERNLSVYLTEPFMDVYIATSMRSDADFISVNGFARRLFHHPELAMLKLRYFDPTQAWIGDRISKGIVEALMLRRAELVVYMAQKGDTFGKDSEASVALGQGKPVVVYVPKLTGTGINSTAIWGTPAGDIQRELDARKVEYEEGLEKKELVDLLLRELLSNTDAGTFAQIVDEHWADFALRDDIAGISDRSLRDPCLDYLDRLVTSRLAGNPADQPVLERAVQSKLAEFLTQAAIHFEGRAANFKDVHPLALQVIVESGVLNGILVVRSVNDCAAVIRQLLDNTIATDIVRDDHNYRLVERLTGSTMRVVSRNRLLTNAFWTHYFTDANSATFLP